MTGTVSSFGTPTTRTEQAQEGERAEHPERKKSYSLGFCRAVHALTGKPPIPDKSVVNSVMRQRDPNRPATLSDL